MEIGGTGSVGLKPGTAWPAGIEGDETEADPVIFSFTSTLFAHMTAPLSTLNTAACMTPPLTTLNLSPDTINFCYLGLSLVKLTSSV